MTFDPVAAFRKTADSKPTERNPKLPLGHHVLEVERFILMPSNNPQFKDAIWFIADFRVLESSSDACPVGSTRSWLSDVNDDMGAANCKSLVMALGSNITEEEASDPTVLAALVGDDQPAAGCTVRVTVDKRTSRANREYTYYGWEPLAQG